MSQPVIFKLLPSMRILLFIPLVFGETTKDIIYDPSLEQSSVLVYNFMQDIYLILREQFLYSINILL